MKGGFRAHQFNLTWGSWWGKQREASEGGSRCRGYGRHACQLHGFSHLAHLFPSLTAECCLLQNDISEKEQRWGAKTIEGSGRTEHIK